MNNLRGIGNQFKVSLPTDEDGYVGRECPVEECKGYFKIIPGTGFRGITECYCPYCGRKADSDSFPTPDQVEYAKSVALRQAMGAIVKDLKSLEFDIKPNGSFGIGLSMKVKSGPPNPIRLYREKALETHIECAGCTLKYAVYGVFAYCPDCGQHNSLQILDKNLEVVSKMLDLAANAESELAERLVENALEDCVSAADGFGRELCRVFTNKSTNSGKAEKVSFQNLEGAKLNLEALFKVDLSAGLSSEEWRLAVRSFQKRHLLSHKMGVVDEEYVNRTGDVHALSGRKVRIEADEVRELVRIIGKLGRYLSKELG